VYGPFGLQQEERSAQTYTGHIKALLIDHNHSNVRKTW